MAYALAQLGYLNSELSPGQLRVRAAITVLPRVPWYEQDGLLICAVSSDDAVTGVVLMISLTEGSRQDRTRSTPQSRGSQESIWHGSGTSPEG